MLVAFTLRNMVPYSATNNEDLLFFAFDPLSNLIRTVCEGVAARSWTSSTVELKLWSDPS